MDSKKLIMVEKLEKTFKLIYKNEDGKITIKEIKMFSEVMLNNGKKL